MDLIRIVERLRPDVTWRGGAVNAYSKATLKKTYRSSQPFPTDAEGVAAWKEIQAEDAAEAVATAQLGDLAKARTFLTNSIGSMSLSTEDKLILRNTFLRLFKNLKYGK